jgi:hypothetical protein
VTVTLNLPGRHNVLNRVGRRGDRLAAGRSAGRDRPCPGKFQGIGRRFNIKGELDFETRPAGQGPAGGRLRPPSARTRSGVRCRAAAAGRSGAGGGVPAAPLQPHARFARRLRGGAVESAMPSC